MYEINTGNVVTILIVISGYNDEDITCNNWCYIWDMPDITSTERLACECSDGQHGSTGAHIYLLHTYVNMVKWKSIDDVAVKQAGFVELWQQHCLSDASLIAHIIKKHIKCWYSQLEESISQVVSRLYDYKHLIWQNDHHIKQRYCVVCMWYNSSTFCCF